MRAFRKLLLTAGVAIALTSLPAYAVILSGTSTRNTSAPAGALAGSGWDLQGRWRGFLGTPISKKFFITAGHAGGAVGTKFYVGDRVFTTTAMWDDPGSDLRIYTVNKAFDAWAPMFTGNKEAGKHAMIFGRGTQRGTEVRVNGVLKGWNWGAEDQVQSWGINQIDQVIAGTSDEGMLLQADFDRNGVDHEGFISAGDSGGGVFIYNKPNARWELAGINYAVDNPYKRSSGGADFSAALFDTGGLFYGGRQVADLTTDVPSNMFMSRISTAQPWIEAVFSGKLRSTESTSERTQGVPEPAGAVGLGLLYYCFRRTRRR